MHRIKNRANKDAASAAPRRGARQSIRLLMLLAWPTLLATVIAVSPWSSRHWALDLTTHMQAHLMLAAAVLTPPLFWAGRRYLAPLCLAASIANGWAVQPWTFASPLSQAEAAEPSAADAASVLRVLFWNVHLGNDDGASVLRLVAKQNADIVVLLEFNGTLAQSLGPLRASHPYHREIAGYDSFGLALYSRIDGTITRGRLDGSVSYLTLRTAPGPLPTVQVTGAHLYPPVGDVMWQARDAQLSDLAQQLNTDTTRPRIVGGDFNITPWAAGYRRFLRTTELLDTRPGFGYAATWPHQLGPAGIPIDQVAVERTIRVVDRRVSFASPESDHAAVLVELAVPR